MKKIRIMKFPAVLLLLTASVFASDLRNEDGRCYEVKVHETSTTRNTSIDGNSTVLSICSDCEIEVVGIGRIKTKGAERVVIKNGKLSRSNFRQGDFKSEIRDLKSPPKNKAEQFIDKEKKL